MGQVDAKKDHRQNHEHDAENQIRHFDGISSGHAASRKILKYQITANQWSDGGADRVKA